MITIIMRITSELSMLPNLQINILARKIVFECCHKCHVFDVHSQTPKCNLAVVAEQLFPLNRPRGSSYSSFGNHTAYPTTERPVRSFE